MSHFTFSGSWRAVVSLLLLAAACFGPQAASAQGRHVIFDDPLYGTWDVEVMQRREAPTTGRVSYWPKVEIECRHIEQGCIYRWMRSKLIPDPGYDAAGSPTHTALSYSGVKALADSPGNLVLEHVYFPRTKYRDTLRTDRDRMFGHWTDSTFSDLSDRITYTRRRARLVEYGLSDIVSSLSPLDTRRVRPGDPLIVSGLFDAFSFGPDARTRGYRPSFVVAQYGDNFDGFHTVEFIDAPGYEPGLPSPIHAPGDKGKIIGSRTEVIIWSEATPGIKRVLIDGEPAFIEVRFINYDGPLVNSRQDTCPAEFYERIKAEGHRLVDRYLAETAGAAAANPRWPAKKAYSYERRPHLGGDYDSTIRKMEVLVAESQANGGPDAWLAQARIHLAADMRIFIGMIAASRNGPCPKFLSTSPLLDEFHARLAEMSQPRYRDYALRTSEAQRLAQKYALNVRKKYYAANVSWGDLLTGKGLSFAETEAVRRKLEAEGRAIAEEIAAGKVPTEEGIRLRVEKAYASVGIEKGRIPAESFDQMKMNAAQSGLGYLLDKSFESRFPTGDPQLGQSMVSHVTSAIALTDLVFAGLDFGTLSNIEKQELPAAQALMENAAYMASLTRRYDFLRRRTSLLEDEIRALFSPD